MTVHYALQRYTLAGRILIAMMICLQVVLIVLWATPVLKNHPFDINKIDIVTQVISIGSQLYIVTKLAVLAYIVQRIAADHAIRQRKCHTVHRLLHAVPPIRILARTNYRSIARQC